MKFRYEILRGVRIAAILLALGLVALVVRRMVPLDFSTPSPVAQQPTEVAKPAKPKIIGGSAAPGSIPPPPPTR